MILEIYIVATCHYCTENLKNQIYMKILEHFTRGDGKSFQGEQT